MIVEEVTEAGVVIESDRKLTYEQLEKRTEKVRLAGGTVNKATVKDVHMWCDDCFIDGEPDPGAIAH